MNEQLTHVLVPIADLQNGIKRMQNFIEGRHGYECISSNARKGVYEDILGIYPHINAAAQQRYIKQLEDLLSEWVKADKDFNKVSDEGLRIIAEKEYEAEFSAYDDRVKNIYKDSPTLRTIAKAAWVRTYIKGAKAILNLNR